MLVKLKITLTRADYGLITLSVCNVRSAKITSKMASDAIHVLAFRQEQHFNQNIRQKFCKNNFQLNYGSISVSELLLTYPSPKPTLNLTCHQSTVVELGEG